MIWLRAALILLLLTGLVRPQEAGEEDDESGETEITISGGDDEGGGLDIRVDPFHRSPDAIDEPNRPPPVSVGEWQPPELDPAARRTLERHLADRGANPDDPGARYRLAEFYADHKWWPQAEAEFLRAAELDPESIRPWEGLLRVYRKSKPEPQVTSITIFFGPGGRVTQESQDDGRDWLTSPRARAERITRAYLEILKRRPGEIARRRELLSHLKAIGDDAGVARQAREILTGLPGDSGTRYELAEAVRRLGVRKTDEETQGLGTPEWAEAVRLLEENLNRSPDHAPSALRLARMLYVEHGRKAQDRVAGLEQRAFFHLFVLPQLASVEFRPETVRMARSLSGPEIARDLWDAAMRPPDSGEEVFWPGLNEPTYCTRWIYLSFPHAQRRDRQQVLENLQRRADEAVSGLLLAYLWHLRGWDDPRREQPNDDSVILQELAVEAPASLGPVADGAAERYLRAADSPVRRRRAVRVLRGLKDTRAVLPLIDALDWDRNEGFSYGVAAALEELDDARAIDGLVGAALDVRRPAERRREAAEALAAFKDPRTVEAMNRLARESDFRLVTAYGLFRLTGDKEALARMDTILVSEDRAGEVLRLAGKCTHPAIEAFLVGALRKAHPDARPFVVELLKKRFWPTAQRSVKAYYLEELRASRMTRLGMRLLGEIGGDDVVDALLAVLAKARADDWELAAEALAQTGDEKALRYFRRMKILDRSETRRQQARALLALAERRYAERKRSD